MSPLEPVSKMQPKLIDINIIPCCNIVGNKQLQGRGPPLPLLNPKNHCQISNSVHESSEEDVDLAVNIAVQAFEGSWAAYTPEKRAECLNRYADLLEAYAEEIAYFESICSGRPISMLPQEIARASAVFRYYAGWADKIKGDSYPAHDGFFKVVTQEPLGVCAGITAWNSSLSFLAWKSAPALACGNTMILKPSEKSPLGTLAAGLLIEAAGFPPGVFQIITGGASVGQILSGHMKIAKISFTGSTNTGRKIQEAATKSNLKRVTLELGGKSPAIVFEDANLETAVFWSLLGITINSGQVCAATSRLYIQRSIAQQFLDRLKQAFSDIISNLGADPQEQGTMYGPLVDEVQYNNVWGMIERGKKVSTVLIGGEPFNGTGYYMAPTILLDPDQDSEIYKEEIFGPVLCVKTFETEEEALKLANETEYGLAASVYTENLKRALRVSAKLLAGTVNVNCAATVGPQVPLGGFKSSGLGRELGEYALRHYTEPKSIWINMN